MPTIHTCFQCNKSFSDKPSRSRKFCGIRCEYEYLRRNQVRKPCEMCGRIFVFGRRHKRVCSWRCLRAFWAKTNTRAYHVIWDGEKQVLEHRFVIESFLGRKLERHEKVHHINKNCRDNRLENLRVVNQREHSLIHSRARFSVKRAIDLFRRGMSYWKIAKALKCHPWSVQYSLNCRGYRR